MSQPHPITSDTGPLHKGRLETLLFLRQRLWIALPYLSAPPKFPASLEFGLALWIGAGQQNVNKNKEPLLDLIPEKQAHLGDTVGLVQDHCKGEYCNKMSHMSFLVSYNMWDLCLYYAVFYEVCNSILSKKCTYLNSKYFIAKKC